MEIGEGGGLVLATRWGEKDEGHFAFPLLFLNFLLSRVPLEKKRAVLSEKEESCIHTLAGGCEPAPHFFLT